MPNLSHGGNRCCVAPGHARHRSTRQDAQMNYLSTLSIFMKQTTYLATLPNPKIRGFVVRGFVVGRDWNFDRSGGDGKGEQAQLGFTFRCPYFFPHSKPDAFYHFFAVRGDGRSFDRHSLCRRLNLYGTAQLSFPISWLLANLRAANERCVKHCFAPNQLTHVQAPPYYQPCLWPPT
jgi:hypothetical protein